ncbi:MAG: DUF4405 domain-containing protein [Rhodoblastus sp.]|nr:DUF4405 domain-containing protein [Rhodoblastus sp.]
MNAILNRLATPLTLGLFAISTISGVALFLHVGQGYFHAMHEWLSIVLLAPFVLHVWKNWNPLVIYARRGALLWPVLASVAIAVPFAWPALSGKQQGGSPAIPMRIMMRAPIADLAPLLKMTPEGLQTALAAKGYKAASTQDSIEKISGEHARTALYAVLPKGR